jgi:hypothetical protein
VESISESTFLPFFGGQSLDWFQVEIVVQMQVIQIFPVDEEVEHVVPLTAHLQTSLYPVELCQLEKLRRLESLEQVPFVLSFGWAVVERV